MSFSLVQTALVRLRTRVHEELGGRAAVTEDARTTDVAPAHSTQLLGLIAANSRMLVAGLVLALCVYHAVAISTFGVAEIGGRRYYLVDDDVMISMSYGRNLARGQGLTYTPGERVEGFTNPLLTLLTAGLHLLPLEARILPGLIMLISLAINVAIVLMLAGLWRRSAHGQAAGVLASLFYVLLSQHGWYAHAGYEVYMELAILVYSLQRIERLRFIDGVILGLLPLTHGTALVMWAILVPASILLSENRRRALVPALTALVPFACYELFRLV
jgi:hypothetical protein